MKFKKRDEPVWLDEDDLWYELAVGAYLNPEELLEEEDAKLVISSIGVLKTFLREAEESGIIEY